MSGCSNPARAGVPCPSAVRLRPRFPSFCFPFLIFSSSQEYKPEFVPTVSSATSTENVDQAFLDEEAADSHVPDSALTGADEFDGFTFVDSRMNQ